MKEIKPKKCAVCGGEFIPSKTTQKVCDWSCAISLGHSNIQKQNAKLWQKEKKIRKEKLKTHKDYLNDLQKVFNEFIRIRDKGKPCVSCGCMVDGNGHASHFFAVGSHPNVRFSEDNVHVSCVECNLHRHGNLAEYSLRLPRLIGQERFDMLVVKAKQSLLKLSIPEIKEKIEYYRNKIKEMKKEYDGI
ncbi:recombination protein NinG [Chryseobacterium sp. JV274]|uniref:recombination protein NinG n=1 Tax=Chryseobacterium sp. JV274 TaxID=1932669 RepID=UPI0015C23475|nr:recombination protein NinG [Chryseobacterium sp. JV274]CAD0220356.1 Bacteriophage Lambda NinG protein [Chryseobacterium sp. JV274]